MTTQKSNASFYDEIYKSQNYFHYPSWIYGPYVSSLIRFCGLSKGASVLDVGCGQGFFSFLFSKHGMKVHGIDLSETGIRTARKLYGKSGITFSVGDAQALTLSEQFDCIFVRSCSLYNTEAFPIEKDVTRNFLRNLKNDGTFVFAYNTNFSSKKSISWRYHSLDDVERHFSGFPNAEVFFLNKATTFLLREHSFTRFATRLNVLLSKSSGMGGELVCVLSNWQTKS
jgi:SAM-dependent methyltransferase